MISGNTEKKTAPNSKFYNSISGSCQYCMVSLRCLLSGTYNPAERAREKGGGKGAEEAQSCRGKAPN